jgi:hypothetical protein
VDAVRYSSSRIVKTRSQALWLVFWAVLILSPSLAMTFTRGHRPAVLAALLSLAAVPFLIARLCWNYLAEAEKRHAEPTPEMEFIFGLMTKVLIAVVIVVSWVLSVVPSV